MIVLPINATDEEILDVVRTFVARLAEEKYDEALAMVIPTKDIQTGPPS